MTDETHKQHAAFVVEKTTLTSYSQDRFLFSHKLNPLDCSSNIPLVLSIEGTLELTILQCALNEIVQRHEVLRSAIKFELDKPVQVVYAPFEVPVQFHDLSEIAPQDRPAIGRKIIQADVDTPFDLAQPPLFRALLIQYSSTQSKLLINVHHAVFDGWSGNLLVEDLMAYYHDHRGATSVSSPELPLQYAEFALQQRAWLNSAEARAQLAFWRHTLQAAPTTLNLPADNSGAADNGPHGNTLEVEFPAGLMDTVSAFSRQHKITPFVVLLTTFFIILYRYTGEKDICIGTPVANRNREEYEGVIGCFVNTLVIRLRLRGDWSFLTLINEVRAQVMAAYSNQDYPFDQLVEQLRPERIEGQSPFYRAMMIYQAEPEQRVVGTVSVHPEYHTRAAHFNDLNFGIFVRDGKHKMWIEYNSALFTECFVKRIGGDFFTLLSLAVSAPQLPVAVGSAGLFAQPSVIVPVAQYAQVSDATVHELFASYAHRHPEHLALLYKKRAISFAQLDNGSNLIARRLINSGVKPGDLVAFFLASSPEVPLCQLAIMKTGSGYLPIDINLPGGRIASILEDACPRLIVTQQMYLPALVDIDTPKLVLGDEDLFALSRTYGAPDIDVAPGQVAYCIYTSGSTGQPKGVLVSHKQVLSFSAGLAQLLDGTPIAGSRMASLASPAFDASVRQLLFMCQGATSCIIPEDVRANMQLLVDFTRDYQLDVFNLTPSTCSVYLDLVEAADEPACLPSVLILGGERIDSVLWERLASTPGLKAFNVYGPTEATVHCCFSPIQKSCAPSIGNSSANAQVYILDEDLNHLPVGAVGELYIAGQVLSYGYLKRPGLTAGRFLPNPFSAVAGSRLYQTGDLAKFDRDGHIEYVGRSDLQVKLRGYRIELGEVEAALKKIDRIMDAVVVIKTDGGIDRMVAYVVPRNSAVLDLMLVKQQLLEWLPVYMVPSQMFMLPALPLNVSNKTDRVALSQRQDSHAAPVEPAQLTGIAQPLAEIWQRVLCLDSVRADDDFFDLGGHSLLAIKLTNHVAKAFQVKLPVAQVFSLRTLQRMADYIALVDVTQGLADGVPLEPATRPLLVPLSFAQERLWLLEQLTPEAASYNIPMVLTLNGALDQQRLRDSFNRLAQRHEILRTAIRLVDDQLIQHIVPHIDIGMMVTSVEHLDAEKRQQETSRIIQQEARTPFNMSSVPLFRLHLIKQSDVGHVLVINLHHMIFDGLSTGLFLRQLRDIYEARADERQANVPLHVPQYTDFALWQRRWVESEESSVQLAFWKKHLHNAPSSLNMPLDFKRPLSAVYHGAVETFNLSDALVGPLQNICKNQQLTMFMLLYAAFNIVLSEWTGDRDIVIGTPVTNRTREEFENTIGLFVNTIVLRTVIEEGMTYAEYFKSVSSNVAESFDHAELPFNVLVQALSPVRVPGCAPLIQAMFGFQTREPELSRMADIDIEVSYQSSEVARFDLVVNTFMSAGKLCGYVEYKKGLFLPSTIQSLIRQFEQVLETLAVADGSVDGVLSVTAMPDKPRQPVGVQGRCVADV